MGISLIIKESLLNRHRPGYGACFFGCIGGRRTGGLHNNSGWFCAKHFPHGGKIRVEHLHIFFHVFFFSPGFRPQILIHCNHFFFPTYWLSSFFLLLPCVTTMVKVVGPMNSQVKAAFPRRPYRKTDKPTPNGRTGCVWKTEAVADIDLLEHQESCGEYRQPECGSSRQVLQVIAFGRFYKRFKMMWALHVV